MGIKRAQFARQLGYPNSSIQGYMIKSNYPPLHRAHEMAQALGTSIEELLTGRQKQHTHGKPLIDEICDYVEGLDENELNEFYALVKYFRAEHFGTSGGDSQRKQRSG